MIIRVTETIENEAKAQTLGFPGTLVGTLATSLLGTLLSGKSVRATGRGSIRAGDGFIQISNGTIRVEQCF